VKRNSRTRNAYGIEALDILQTEAALSVDDEALLSLYQDELLEASQQKYSYATLVLYLRFWEVN
jgi:hypothetical protein